MSDVAAERLLRGEASSGTTIATRDLRQRTVLVPWFTPSGGSPPYFSPTETLVMFNEKPMIDLAFALVVLAVLFAFVRDCRGTTGDIHGVYVQ